MRSSIRTSVHDTGSGPSTFDQIASSRTGKVINVHELIEALSETFAEEHQMECDRTLELRKMATRQLTVAQATGNDSADWKRMRRMCISSSICRLLTDADNPSFSALKAVYKIGLPRSRSGTPKRLVHFPNAPTDSMRYGIENEPAVLARFAQLTGTVVLTFGVVQHPDHLWLVDSPDGVVYVPMSCVHPSLVQYRGKLISLEVKCPSSTLTFPCRTD